MEARSLRHGSRTRESTAPCHRTRGHYLPIREPVTQTPDDDRELFARMHRGSPEQARKALRLVYERHAPDVLRFLRGLVAHDDADDLLQETFLAASRNAAGFRHGSALPWLLTIAGRRVRDERKYRARRSRRERAVGEERSELQEASVTDDGIDEHVRTLPPRQRAALELRYVHDLTHAQVASVLGVSLRTAKAWSAQGLAMLRDALEAER